MSMMNFFNSEWDREKANEAAQWPSECYVANITWRPVFCNKFEVEGEPCSVCRHLYRVNNKGRTPYHKVMMDRIYGPCEGSNQSSLFQKARDFAAHVRQRARKRGLPDDWVLDLNKP